ncbi:MAG TPA: hypothetical protein V6C84_23480 [Coleofasciculaceae cyanobacterium]|jgi:hypothetical protein
MSKYDQRQYQLMKLCIEGFEIGNVNLRVLISSLEGLLDVLQEASEEWKASFRSAWWTLEEVYAVASDRGQNYLSSEEQVLVYEAINEIKQLLED